MSWQQQQPPREAWTASSGPVRTQGCSTHDLIIIGAGPAGLALAAEAGAAGYDPARTLVLEKASSHSATIRQLYPEHKLTTANYKGFSPRCDGLLSMGDMTKAETLAYFDRLVSTHRLSVRFGAEVRAMRRLRGECSDGFRVESAAGSYIGRFVAVAIGIFGRPNKPREYALPPTLKQRLLFDLSSISVRQEQVLVVGGGDSAIEYAESLHAAGNAVTLSYRGSEFTRPGDRNLATLAALETRRAIEVLRASNVVRVDDEAGRPRVTFRELPGAPRVFDRILYALGGMTPTSLLRTFDIPFDGSRPAVDAAGETALPGVFLVGDLAMGKAGGSINTAFNSAARTMRRIVERDGARSPVYESAQTGVIAR